MHRYWAEHAAYLFGQSAQSTMRCRRRVKPLWYRRSSSSVFGLGPTTRNMNWGIFTSAMAIANSIRLNSEIRNTMTMNGMARIAAVYARIWLIVHFIFNP